MVKKKSPLVFGVSVILMLVIGSSIGGVLVMQNLLKPVNPQTTETKMFVVNKGESFNSISKRLAAEGIIKNPWSLKLANYFKSEKIFIQVGSFRLSPSMSPEKILDQLAHGRVDIWVTLLEGWRREEIADELAKTLADNNISFDKTKFLDLTKNKEGYLFPDTYLIPVNTSESAIETLLESTTQKKFTSEMKTQMAASGRDLQQILTMASIVEREARSSNSRKIVAGILWKRIEKGWPLQVDATLQYAKGYDRVEQTWWKPPLAADKDIKSPYNTYLNVGLPPAPICAPSLDSIQATIAPQQSNYWYYLTDAQGGMHYAETLEQHNANVHKYLR